MSFRKSPSQGEKKKNVPGSHTHVLIHTHTPRKYVQLDDISSSSPDEWYLQREISFEREEDL